jgi:hypothetical protein
MPVRKAGLLRELTLCGVARTCAANAGPRYIPYRVLAGDNISPVPGLRTETRNPHWRC